MRMDPRHRWVSLLMVSLVIVTVAWSVNSDGPARAAEASVEQAITEFGKKPEQIKASLAAIHRLLRERPAELRTAALKHLNATDPTVRFAALYALALTAEHGPSMEALRPFLESKDVNERMRAAVSLVARGEKTALPVLINALGSDTLLDRRPPRSAWELAKSVLVRYTEKDFGLVAAQDGAAAVRTKAAWERWWTQDGAGLRWDATKRRYRGATP